MAPKNELQTEGIEMAVKAIRSCCVAIAVCLYNYTPAISAQRTVVYVSSPQCIYCRRLEISPEKHQLLSRWEDRGYKFKEIKFKKMRQSHDHERWPEKFRAVEVAHMKTNIYPGFYLVEDGQVLKSANDSLTACGW